MKSNLKVIITTGDATGIGLEVTTKALLKVGPQKGVTFYLYKQSGNQASLIRKLSAKFKVQTVGSWHEALQIPVSSARQLIEISNLHSPAHWVESAALACVTKAADAMVTAPLSKSAIKESGLKDVGHTDILKRLCGKSDAFMGFVGSKFNVVLATGHIPISAISEALSAEVIELALSAAILLKPLLPTKKRNKPIAILGLNPHAGDKGIIGSEEDFWLTQAVKNLSEKHKLVGPLPPDSAFLKENWDKYSCYLALYHDQGLIPFKMAHGHDNGVHMTLGLPIVRTSVDHGTAKDIFGKNKANPNSMIDAIKAAISLVRG
jgi:4-hydroxythreonine-4-phosphate dehydrogenase